MVEGVRFNDKFGRARGLRCKVEGLGFSDKFFRARGLGLRVEGLGVTDKCLFDAAQCSGVHAFCGRAGDHCQPRPISVLREMRGSA